MLTVRERSPEKVVAGKRMLRDEADDDDSRAARPLEWRVLESGILALKTPIEVATISQVGSAIFTKVHAPHVH